VTARSTAKPRGNEPDRAAARRRILNAAFSAFTEAGYAETSTLEIATRAHVSKRELYKLVGNKQEMLAACIRERAKRLQVPADLPAPRDGKTLAQTLIAFGTQLLREVSDPAVVGVFRLAIAEAVRAPEVARALDSLGREASRAALRQIIAQGRAAGLLVGAPAEIAEQFSGLLWGNLMLTLVLGVADRPSSHEITRRAQDATAAFLKLYLERDESGRPLPAEAVRKPKSCAEPTSR
jgi:AcrR family transcriptional regulator